MTQEVDDWFESLDSKQRPILEELRRTIFASSPDFTEALKWGQPCYSLNGLVCYLQKAKAHVSLGFPRGALLNDGSGMLEGEGKEMRHLKFPLSSGVDEQRKSVGKALIEAAIQFDKSSSGS